MVFNIQNQIFKTATHIQSFIIPTSNTMSWLGCRCFDETNIAFVTLSRWPILPALLLLIKWLYSIQWLACICATVNKNIFGESYKQLLTTPADLGQQVNRYRKAFFQMRDKGRYRNTTDRDIQAEIMGVMMQSLLWEMTQTWIRNVYFWHAVKIFLFWTHRI